MSNDIGFVLHANYIIFKTARKQESWLFCEFADLAMSKNWHSVKTSVVYNLITEEFILFVIYSIQHDHLRRRIYTPCNLCPREGICTGTPQRKCDMKYVVRICYFDDHNFAFAPSQQEPNTSYINNGRVSEVFSDPTLSSWQIKYKICLIWI